MDRVFSKDNQRADPIQERIGQGMFTDREQEMAFLMDWTNGVAKKQQKSIAYLSPRRYGKTALFERFYNRIFWERDDVIPFYYELGEAKRYIMEFIEDYYVSFLRQYLAYRIKNAELAFQKDIEIDDLYELARQAGEKGVMHSLERIPKWIEKGPDRFFDIARSTPHMFASRTGQSVIVMFDEFQRLDQVLYFDEARERQCHRYTGSFSNIVESSWAPMLIAGSQMTVLTRQALSKGMAGRVGRSYLDRMPLAACVELTLKLAKFKGLEVSLDLAYTIACLAWRHPYYIWCLFNTYRVDSGMSNRKELLERMNFEVEDDHGRINEFWREHFVENIDAMNEPHARQMIFYLMKKPEGKARVDEIVADLGLPISADEANRQLRKLVWGDLIKQVSLGGVYGGVKDPMLERTLRLEYSWELQNMERSDVATKIELEFLEEALAAEKEMNATLRGELSTWLGRIAEAFIEKLMKGFFNGQTVSGQTYFHSPHDIKLSKFKRVYNTFASPPGATQTYQIDLYAQPENDDELPWIVESKNWKYPVDQPTVAYFLKGAENLAAEQGHNQVICWFYARSGFTKPARDLLEREGVLYTEQDQLERMLEDLEVLRSPSD